MGKKSKKKAQKNVTSNRKTGNCKRSGKGNGLDDPFGNEDGIDNDSAPSMSIYQVYKAATLRFKEELIRLVPTDTNIFKNDNVHSFVDAADYVKDSGLSVSVDLLRDLRTAISVRKKYTNRLVEGCDEGHTYFLLVLNYCLQVLKPLKIKTVLRKTATKAKAYDDQGNDHDAKDEEKHAFVNQFAALSMENDDGESSDNDSESQQDDTPAARPQPPSKTYSYDDLLCFPDRTKCLFLFDAMAYYAAKLTRCLKNLKETMRMEADGKFRTSGVIPELICFGTAAQSMILDIQQSENSLYIDCPNLQESPYNLLAICFCSPLIKLVSNNIQTHSPLSHRFKDENAISFIGDIIESVFRCQMNNYKKISERFSRRWKLPEHWRNKNNWLALIVKQITLKSTMSDFEAKFYNKANFFQNLDGMSVDDIEWMKDRNDNVFSWESISGKQSILNTMKMVDMVGSTTIDEADTYVDNTLIPMFMCQKQWDEQNNPAQSIRGDMDSVLFKMLILVLESKWRFDGHAVPMERHMLPIIAIIRKWTLGMKAKPPFVLVFGLHLILISIYEMQGDGDVSRLGGIAKRAYDKFFSQAEEHLKLGVPRSPKREHFLKFTQKIRRVTELADDNCTELEKNADLLFWNPLCAGLFLGYTNIYLSLQAGFTTINTDNESHAIFHIYNALKVRGMVGDNLPLLGDIDRCFSHLKCLWNGWEKPQQGKFTYRFHLSMGATNDLALWKQDMARYKKVGGEEPAKIPSITLSKFNHTLKTSKRVSTKINPGEVSNTFKMHCLSNFEGTEDEEIPKPFQMDPSSSFPLSLQIQEKKSFLVLAKGVICELDNLLKYNMVAVSTVFSQFLFETFHPDEYNKISSLEARLDLPVDHPGDVRGLVNICVAEEILEDLDYANEESYKQLAEKFENFFINLDMDRVLLH